MLVGAVRRLAGKGGDPVVQLQTNFGGGKTHSMLALYHLFSGIAPKELAGVEAVMQEAGAIVAARPLSLLRGGWCSSATRSPPAIRRSSRMAPWCARCGASWHGSWAANRRMTGWQRMTSVQPAPATCCASCSWSTGRA